MNTLGKAIVLVSILLATPCANAQSQVPLPADVPAGLSDSQRTNLVEQRSTLINMRETLKTKVIAHNQKCRGIPDDSPLVAECEKEQKALQQELTSYASSVRDFDQAIAQAKVPSLAKKIAAQPQPSSSHTIGELRALIAADEEAIRQLGFQKRADEFAEWEKLTDGVKQDLKKESLGIILRLAMDEEWALVNKGVPAVASLDSRGAARLIKKLEEFGAPDPFLADAIRALARAGTKEEKLKVARMIVAANTKLVRDVRKDYEKNSEAKWKARAETILEIGSSVHSPQLRLLVGTTELTAALAFTVGEQHIIESRIVDMTNLTEQQLKQLQLLSTRLQAHVRELNALKQKK